MIKSQLNSPKYQTTTKSIDADLNPISKYNNVKTIEIKFFRLL